VLKELFTTEREYLNFFFDQIDFGATETILQLMYNCKGMMIFTGIGKSGLVAKKIALTMTSTGSRAFYISPIDALHGDLGIVSSDDLVIMLSKSGESDELLSLVPFIKLKGVELIAVVSNASSRLAKACEHVLVLPHEKELCPYDMAPTISTVTQMIMGDVLAIALMRLKKFSLESYALNHPSGRIGKRITVKVKDIMLTGNQVPTCQPHAKLVDTLVELSNKRCGCVLVVNKEHSLKGIFTDGDLRRALITHGPKVLDLPMEQLMTPSARWITPCKLAWDAMKLMEANPNSPITTLPVLEDNNKVTGLIKMHDIIQSGI